MRTAIACLVLFSLVSCAGKGGPYVESLAKSLEKPDGAAMLALVRQLAPHDDARISGGPGEKAAAELIAERLRALGLETRTEAFPILAFAAKGASLEPEGGPAIPANALLYSPGTVPSGIRARLADGGIGLPDQLDAAGSSGAIVLVRRGQLLLRDKAINAAMAGALGMVIYDPEREEFQGTLLGPGALPSAAISGPSAIDLVRRLGEGESIGARLRVDTETKPGRSLNLIAKRPGGSGRAILVGAHLDSVSTPGALDNASGLACLVEVARLIQKLRLGPELYFVGFGSEELGDLGSGHFLESWKGTRIAAMLALDVVGSGEFTMVYSRTGGSNAAVSAASTAAAALGMRIQTGASEGSDHVPFDAAGIPAAFLMREPENRYHSDADEPGAVSTAALEETARLAALTILLLAR
jgi:aminopeptidase YwaD